jgi:hypothetical protein
MDACLIAVLEMSDAVRLKPRSESSDAVVEPAVPVPITIKSNIFILFNYYSSPFLIISFLYLPFHFDITKEQYYFIDDYSNE